MHPRKRTAPQDWALANPLRPPALRRTDLTSSLFAAPFSRQTALRAHHSCVNALALSHDSARWLATGGDDQRVLLWNANSLDDDGSGLAPDPVGCYAGAQSNIFTIAFSCDGTRIFSSGNDAVILAHDLETSSSTFPHSLDGGTPPLDAWLDHDDAVMGISAHPFNPALFVSASSDGALLAFDTRASPGCVGTIQDSCGMNDVVHHPVTPELFVYSGESGQMGLVDGRMGWSTRAAGSDSEVKLAREVSVVQYDTTVLRRDPHARHYSLQPARPNVSSSAISPCGRLVCATLSGYLPTMYELSASSPLAHFSSSAPSHDDATSSAGPPPSFPAGYRNTTTAKHGSFGGGAGAEAGRGLYYAAGSDDFKTYMWQVPSVEALREARQKLPLHEEVGSRIVFYSKTDVSKPHDLTLPASIGPAHGILTGHRSVVNTALFHPQLPVLYTAGVEKVVVRHAPASTSPSTPDVTVRKWEFVPREPATHARHPGLDGPADAALLPGAASGRDERLRAEDTEVLEYFDGLVENEGGETLWEVRDLRMAGETSSEEGEKSEGEEELRLAEGEEGVTRRMLRTIYALEDELGHSSGEEDGADSGDASSGADGE